MHKTSDVKRLITIRVRQPILKLDCHLSGSRYCIAIHKLGSWEGKPALPWSQTWPDGHTLSSGCRLTLSGSYHQLRHMTGTQMGERISQIYL